jgi:hypothetical protein
MKAGILCAYGHENFISESIRWVSQHLGEARTRSNHNGDWFRLERGETVEFPDGTVLTGPCEFVIESTFKGTQLLVDWRKRYDTKKQWAIVLIPKGTTQSHAHAILYLAISYLGTKYDLWSIVKQLGDGLLGKLIGKEVYLVRRIKLPVNRENRYNICTWLMGWTWEKGRGWKFHVKQYRTVVEKRRWTMRMRRVFDGWTTIRKEWLNPDHPMDDAFEYRPNSYDVAVEVGRRPEVNQATATKIDTDLGLVPIA